MTSHSSALTGLAAHRIASLAGAASLKVCFRGRSSGLSFAKIPSAGKPLTGQDQQL